MSLYNQLFGENSLASELLNILNLELDLEIEEDKLSPGKWPVGRFRDIYLDDKCEKITLYTRNGGGNREYYQYVFDALNDHPNYIKDFDDDYDNTFAYIEFSVPDKFKSIVKKFSKQDNRTIDDKFKSLLNKMGDKTKDNDPEIKRVKKIGDEIFSKIQKNQRIIKI